MLKKELEIEFNQTKNSGYYTTTPELNKGNVRLRRKRARHADLIEEDEKSEDGSGQEEEDEEENHHPNRYRKRKTTWFDRINQKSYQLVKSKDKINEDKNDFKKRIIKEKKKIKKLG